MPQKFVKNIGMTMDYWLDDGWFIGQLQEAPSVASQGTTIESLEANIQDAYQLIIKGQ